jgi:hypothetical protein
VRRDGVGENRERGEVGLHTMGTIFGIYIPINKIYLVACNVRNATINL